MKITCDSKIVLAPELFGKFGELKLVGTRDIARDVVKGADVLLVRSETKVDRDLLEGTGVRFVGTATIGTDHVDLPYLQDNGIGFASAPGSNANSVAEYVTAAILAVSQRLGISPAHRTIGIVGVGNTGGGVLRKVRALGMNVLLNDPPLARETAQKHYRPLDELMEADIISLHVPLTREGKDRTYHLFDGARIAAMKRGSILINASRGAVVDTAGLKEGLRTGGLSACILDVWEREPAIDVDLLGMVALGTPHIAGYSYDGKLNASYMLLHEMQRFFGLTVPVDDIATSHDTDRREVPASAGELYQVIGQIVRECYDIETDDKALRGISGLPEEERKAYFRQLRAHYRVRREFNALGVRVDPSRESLVRVLTDLGFTVNTSPAS